MNIVVIGGAGFIGSHLVDRLVAAGDAVDVVDDLTTGSLGNLADARAAGGELKFHHLDADSPEFDTLCGLRHPELIYHLGLFPRGGASSGVRGHAAAFESILVTLEAARRHGVAKVVAVLPASSLYGQPAASSLPVKEGAIEPRGIRGVAARAAIDALSIYRERFMIEFTAVAASTVYGPRQPVDGGVVAAFVHAAREHIAPTIIGDGRQTRDFVFIDDTVDALVRAGERGSGLVINVGTGEQTTIRDLWTLVSGGAGAEPEHAPARPDELVRFAVSPVRARIHLGWSPWTELVDGIARVR